MLALIALIVVGFGMATLGVALLCLGEVPFIAGKRIQALRSRLIGLILAGFLPLALGLRQATNYLVPEVVDGQAVTWSLFGFCWFFVLVLLFRVMVPKREPRKRATGAAQTSKEFEKAEPATTKTPEPESLAWMEPEPEPVKKPAAKKQEPEPAKKAAPTNKPAGKKAPKAPAEGENPFDFS